MPDDREAGPGRRYAVPTPPRPAVVRSLREARRPAPRPDAGRARRLAKERFLRLGLVLVAASVISPAVSAASPAKAYVVASGSMEPGMPTGSLAFARNASAPEVGDVVVYWSPVGANQVHRVREVRELDGQTYYVTQGDNNAATDSFAVPAKDIRGVVQGHVPYLGWLWMLPAAWQVGVFAALLAAYVVVTLLDLRAALKVPRLAMAASALVVLLLAPSAFGLVVPAFPGSDLGIDVATTPLPLSAGTMASANVASDQNSATVTADAPKLWKEVSLWGCPLASGACGTTLPPATYAEQAGARVRVDMADHDPDPVVYFEAYLAAPTGRTAFAVLRDAAGGSDVAGSEVTTASTSLTLVRSPALTLTGAKDYTFRIKHDGLVIEGNGGELRMARLVLAQGYPLKTETQVRISAADETSATSYTDPARQALWRYDGAEMDGMLAAYFEAVAYNDAGMLTASKVRLWDRTTSSAVVELTFGTLATTATRTRSADILGSLVAGHEYEAEFQAGTSVGGLKLHLHQARVVLQQSEFTKTLRYADLSWAATTTATSFTAAGFPARYHMDTEWGSRSGWFEATLRSSGAGSTASARLYDNGAGAAIASSQVDVAGTTLTRARSGTITLSTSNVTYAAQLQASANTTEVRSAWLLVPQASGKTYDHALQASNTVVNACTWTFTLQQTTSSNLARITSATLGLRGDSALQAQVVVSAGSVTQTAGSSVSVPFGTAVQHVVSTQPASAGTSTLGADLLGTCQGSGIRTAQPLTFTLA